MLSNPVARKVALAVIFKIAIIATAVYFAWPAPKTAPMPQMPKAVGSTSAVGPG